MRLRHLLILCPIFLVVSNCGSAPKVTVCISDPSAGGLDCYNENTGVSSFIKYEDSDKYVALPPSDAQTLLNYCAQAVKGQ